MPAAVRAPAVIPLTSVGRGPSALLAVLGLCVSLACAHGGVSEDQASRYRLLPPTSRRNSTRRVTRLADQRDILRTACVQTVGLNTKSTSSRVARQRADTMSCVTLARYMRLARITRGCEIRS